MNQLAARMPSVRTQAIISLVLAGVAVLGAYTVGGWIVIDDMRSILLVGVAVALFAIALLTLRNWRLGSYVFLVWLLFEDLFRKYLGNNMMIYFAKDVLAAMTMFSFWLSIRRGKEKSFRPPFMLLLSLFIWLGILQVFNVNSPSLLYGLLGIKLYFFYIPLMFLGYALINTDQDLHRFLMVSMSLAGVISLLGIIQAIVGPTFLNPSDLDANIVALSSLRKVTPLTGEFVNVPSSVFVSSGRYDWYLELSAILGLATIGYLLLHKRRVRWLAFGVMGLIAVAIVLSGSRGAIVFDAASVIAIGVGFFWGTKMRHGQFQKLFKALAWGLVIATLGIGIAALLFPTQLAAPLAFYSQTLTPNARYSELTSRSWDYPIYNLLSAFSNPHWLMGNGIGTSSLGVQYISAYLNKPPLSIGAESGFGTLILELGILGPFLWIAWAGALVIAAWRVVKRLRHTSYFPVGVAIAWLAFLVLFPFTYGGMPAYQNFVLNAYLWLLVGILFRLPELAGLGPAYSNVRRPRPRLPRFGIR
jgi:hypothetical protein